MHAAWRRAIAGVRLVAWVAWADSARCRAQGRLKPLIPEIDQVPILVCFSPASVLWQVTRGIGTLEDLAIFEIPLSGARVYCLFPFIAKAGFVSATKRKHSSHRLGPR